VTTCLSLINKIKNNTDKIDHHIVCDHDKKVTLFERIGSLAMVEKNLTEAIQLLENISVVKEHSI